MPLIRFLPVCCLSHSSSPELDIPWGAQITSGDLELPSSPSAGPTLRSISPFEVEPPVEDFKEAPQSVVLRTGQIAQEIIDGNDETPEFPWCDLEAQSQEVTKEPQGAHRSTAQTALGRFNRVCDSAPPTKLTMPHPKRAEANPSVATFSLNDYKMEKFLGVQDSNVTQVRHKVSGERFALKKVKKDCPFYVHTIREIEFFDRKLTHPNIVKLYASFENPQNRYFLFELAENSLYDHIVKYPDKPFSENEIHSYFQQLLNVLVFLHRNQIAHRDIKTENILLFKNGVLKLADFGFAKKIERSGRHSPCGSPEFAAPEILTGNEYGLEADHWSLGTLLYVLTYKQHPFDNGGQAKTVSVPTAPTGRSFWASSDLKDLINRLLHPSKMYRLGNRELCCKEIYSHPWMKKFSQLRDL